MLLAGTANFILSVSPALNNTLVVVMTQLRAPFDGAEGPESLQDSVAVRSGHTSKWRLALNIGGQSADDEVDTMIAL